MGTRHYQKVINKEGEVKVAQYGQWDGYPSGQGVGILEFLHSADLEVYLNNLNKLKVADSEFLQKMDDFYKEVQSRKLDYDAEREALIDNEQYLVITRDCGSNIHKLIEDGKIEFIYLTDQSEADSWCAGFFTIDFQKNEFSTEFGDKSKTYKLDDLPTTEEYLEFF